MERTVELDGGEKASRECPKCNSVRIWKDGKRNTPSGSIQRFYCRKCAYRFSVEKSYKENPITDDCQLCAKVKDAKKLDTTTEIKTVVGDGKTNLIEYAWRLKKRNIKDDTIRTRVSSLNQLLKKNVDLFNPDSVETFLATEPMTIAKKRNCVSAYRSFTKVYKISWEPIKVKYQPKLPYQATHEELMAFIHASGPRLATFLMVALDIGARIGEICRLQWTDVNVENLTITINNPEKNSNPRRLKVTQQTIAMTQALQRKYGKNIFNPNPRTIRQGFETIRKRLTETQKNQNFMQIHVHSFRHYFASNLYRKTKILKTVQDALGHKSIMNTEVYTKMVVFKEEEYYSATAKTLEEVCKLAEDGWSFFTEIDGIKVFRKPK